MPGIKLTDLIDKSTLQKIQEGFSRFTGIASIITDTEGVPITKGSGFTKFCFNLNRKSELGNNLCQLCDKKGTLKAIKDGKVSVYTCHAGMVECAAPITVNDEFAGCFIGGQVRPAKLDETLLRRRALRLGLDPDEYVREAENTKIKNPREVARAAEFLSELAGLISTMALKNFNTVQNTKMMEKASKAQALFVSEMARKMEESIKRWTKDISLISRMDDVEKARSRISEIAEQGTELYSIVADSMTFIEEAEGRASLYEKVYSPSLDFNITAGSIKKTCTTKDTDFEFNLDESVPEMLLGDVTRLSQIIYKLCQNAFIQAKGSKVKLDISAKKQSYASILKIKIINEKSRTSDEEIKFITDYFLTGSKAFLVHKIINDMGLPLVYMLIHQLSGTFSIERNQEKNLLVTIEIPQLDAGGEEI
ncbi:PocR ligand-binding domain-containing protein [Treponema sp.]|uniref:PocR ligand-binding domain-containing protein n=1 Tax=Treponema sp. TaxID=166 RepID=UPI0025EBC9B3|nr:PocR ligand-binding domain-containing protein [Treponema sp.]MCR5217120.1 PocR ligand-binding domain-containing protein [Treponema sp.]